ncbi:hypothetical protein KHA80_23000 [Anaerobacillus sp. HL2]|nr:hypothetical protein KHA80_23000 [Anaerobacillus sp. HL2]
MGAIGSSFYFFMAIFFVYRLVTLKPAFQGDDTFMAAVGLVLVIIVTTVAFTTCFIYVSLSKKGVS